ncbi:MAG: hypothetical protein ACUVQY_11415 [Thermoproteota archaeon]
MDQEDWPRVLLGIIVGGAVALGLIAILGGLSDSSSTSSGRLLARRERRVIERTEWYEKEVKHQITQVWKAEILEPKRFVEIYGRKKG